MRESNFAFPAQNRACVCISSQLYDRRALDTKSPLPLHNSLSHLTYLTSTSPRIREILTYDGGLERLVRILRDFCSAPPPPESPSIFYGLQPPSAAVAATAATTTPKSFDRPAAYRFSLAFQCVANIGVRGSEHIRSRVVQAGTLEVVACVLESWLQARGFAVLPSSSASGLPRESKEQRMLRRQAALAQQQAQQAAEIARALERARVAQETPQVAAAVANLSSSMVVARPTVGRRAVLAQQDSTAPAMSRTTTASTSASDDEQENRIVRPSGTSGANVGVIARPTAGRLPAVARAVLQDQSAPGSQPTTASASASDEEHDHPRLRPGSATSMNSVASSSAGARTTNASPDTSAHATPVTVGTPAQTIVVSPGVRDRSGTIVARPAWEQQRRRARTVTQRPGAGNRPNTDTEDDADIEMTHDDEAQGQQGGAQERRAVGIVAGDDESAPVGLPMFGNGGTNLNMLLDGVITLEQNDDLAMGAPPGAPGATQDNAAGVDLDMMNMHDDEHDEPGPGTVQATPRQPVTNLPPLNATTPRATANYHSAYHRSEEGPYREEDVLIALQLLAYLSKYPHVREAFYMKHNEPKAEPASAFSPAPLQPQPQPRESALGGFARALVGGGMRTIVPTANTPAPAAASLPNSTSAPRTAAPSPVIPHAAPLYPRPSMTQSPNVFSLVERFTFRPSTTEAALPSPPEFLPPEIQYWASVVMRNACRKDETRGGIRQCANMLCGKWEESPRQFAKCRRCRKAKYCGKECQSRAWSEGHRFWCSAKEDDAAVGADASGSGALDPSPAASPRPMRPMRAAHLPPPLPPAPRQPPVDTPRRHAHGQRSAAGRTGATNSMPPPEQPPAPQRRRTGIVSSPPPPPGADDMVLG